MIMYDLGNFGAAAVTGTWVTYWAEKGLPDFEGHLSQFSKEYPEQSYELTKLIRNFNYNQDNGIRLQQRVSTESFRIPVLAVRA